MTYDAEGDDSAADFRARNYRERLECWAIVRLLPNMQRVVVAKFRSCSDADGHLEFLRQHLPEAKFIVVFDVN